MSEQNETTAAAAAPSPIAAGATVPKKKKGAAKAKPTSKKASAKGATKGATKKSAKTGQGRATHWPKTHVIVTTAAFKQYSPEKGSRSAAYAKAIKSGMTIEAFLDALKAAGQPPQTGYLQSFEKRGFVTVKAK